MKNLKISSIFRSAVFCILLVILTAGHHFESDMAKKYPQFDLTDLFAFATEKSTKTVFILSFNPSTSIDSTNNFGKNGIYSFHIAGDKKLKSGKTYNFSREGNNIMLSILDDASYSIGKKGKEIGSFKLNSAAVLSNGFKVWAGEIKDPFFGNGAGLQKLKTAAATGKFDSTAFDGGEDLFLNRSTTGIVMEIPNEMLPKEVFYYASSAFMEGGHWHGVNRIAHVLLPHLYLEEMKDIKTFNTLDPSNDLKKSKVVSDVIFKYAKLAGFQNNPGKYADSITKVILPDIIQYKIGSEANYGYQKINGRKLTDDGMNTALAILIGKATDDKVYNSGKNSTVFPYIIPLRKTSEAKVEEKKALPAAKEKKINQWIIIGVGAIVLALIILFIRRRKTNV